MKYILGFLILLFVNSSFAGNPFWIQLDKKIIKSLVAINKDSIRSLEVYFLGKSQDKNMIELGFGWKVWAPSKSGGYISINSQFYYYNDSLVSFEITPNLPDEMYLRKRYLKWYRPFFEVSDENRIQPYSLNSNRLFQPLKEYDGKISRVDLNKLMYPSPNLTYSWTGGYSNSMQSSRIFFKEYSDTLDAEELEYLTYSINPLTRFYALEELMRRNKFVFEGEGRQSKWAERCFREVPKIKTLNGCIGSKEDSKSLVYYFSQLK